MTPRTITLALIEVTQTCLGAVVLGLERVKRELTKAERREAKAARFADQVRSDMERL